MTAPENRRVLVLVGPTASGKTAVSEQIALQFPAEIISADSRQVYRYLDIGTAKPDAATLARIPHHFINELSPEQDFNAGEFGEKGRKVIDEIFGRGKLPLVVGGSGLYVQSLIDGLFEGPGADPGFRDIMEMKVRDGRVEELMQELRRVDPVTAGTIDPTKPRRIVRALEVFHLTGLPLSAHHRDRPVEIHFVPAMFGLLWERKELYERIDARCDAMLEGGLLQEVEALASKGFGPQQNALNTVGYAEAFAFRRGEIDREEMVRLFKRNSRRYAKRQMTWFRRDPRIHWVPMSHGTTAVAAEIVTLFRQNGETKAMG